MSSSNNSRSSSIKKNSNQSGSNRSSGTVRSPCCPHCSNVNKFSKTNTILPTDHFLRETPSPDSKLVCPVLLATECRYCGGIGHTISKCPIVEENKKRDAELARCAERTLKKQSEFMSTPVKTTFRSNNAFGALDSGSDDEVKPKREAKKTSHSGRTVMGSSNSSSSSSSRSSTTTSAVKRKRDEPVFDFPALPSIPTVASNLIVSDLVPSMNFMNAIKTPVVLDEKPRVSAPIGKSSTICAFNTAKPSWAESESDDEDTESDRQRMIDEHAAWMELRLQQEAANSARHDSAMHDIALRQSMDIDGYTTNAYKYNCEPKTIDSW